MPLVMNTIAGCSFSSGRIEHQTREPWMCVGPLRGWIAAFSCCLEESQPTAWAAALEKSSSSIWTEIFFWATTALSIFLSGFFGSLTFFLTVSVSVG